MKSLLLSLLLLIFLNSCSYYKLTPEYWKMKSEFKKELDFVQIILNNPDKMQDIIKTSEFYDNQIINLNGRTFKYFIDYLKPDNEGNKAQILGFARTSSGDGKGKILYENAKGISIYKPGSYNRIVFVFFELEGKVILGEICSVTM